MKQHIELSQLEELNGKQLKAISTWWSQGIHQTLPGTTLSLLTIGQMIQLLDEYDKLLGIRRTYESWIVNETEDTYLCDALWGEVKKLLNKI